MNDHKDNGIDYVQIVGKNLQKIRKDNDITQLQLGKMIGVDRAIISRMENPTSKTNPGVKDLQRIANALNIDILSFFSLDGQIYEKEYIDELINSVKEAKMALDVGKIFFDDRLIIAYSELGIGRLIYQLPIPLCKLFIKEIFDGHGPDEFDEETLMTIYKFFENSLNVSETSRQLFIHRNTLVYRLDKLQKQTGLDLRVFEDAITFKIALMVVKYMNYMETLEY